MKIFSQLDRVDEENIDHWESSSCNLRFRWCGVYSLW